MRAPSPLPPGPGKAEAAAGTGRWGWPPWRCPSRPSPPCSAPAPGRPVAPWLPGRWAADPRCLNSQLQSLMGHSNSPFVSNLVIIFAYFVLHSLFIFLISKFHCISKKNKASCNIEALLCWYPSDCPTIHHHSARHLLSIFLTHSST